MTASIVETIRLRWELQRSALIRRLQAAQPPVTVGLDQVSFGQTRVGGAFILAVLLVETGWLKLAHLYGALEGAHVENAVA